MALSGPEALHSLDEALRDIRREEDEIAKRLARSAELVTKMRATEGELFRQLAKVRLDPATQAELGDTARCEEDVLSYIAFPQVAENFFEKRREAEEHSVRYSIEQI